MRREFPDKQVRRSDMLREDCVEVSPPRPLYSTYLTSGASATSRHSIELHMPSVGPGTNQELVTKIESAKCETATLLVRGGGKGMAEAWGMKGDFV